MKKLNFLGAAAIALTAFSISTPAYADMWFPSWDFYTTLPQMGLEHQRTMSMLENAGTSDDNEDTADEKEGLSPTPQTSPLSYKPSPAIRRNNQVKFIEAAKSLNPGNANAIERDFASTDIIEQVGAAIGPMGLKTDNVADAFTFYWINSWEIANQRELTPSLATVQAVKNQVEKMLGDGDIKNYSDIEKQDMAENLLIQTVFISIAKESVKNNPAEKASLAKAVLDRANQLGLNLDRFNLTEKGFELR